MRAWTKGNGIECGARIGALATLWLVPVFIFTLAFSSGWVSTWRSFGVPAMTPQFLDLYSIPTAVETLHKGADPLVMNWGDPYHRPMNYPRVWMYLFSAARITRDKITFAALFLCASYLTCVSFLIARTTRAIEAIVILLASLSVAPLFAIERGNNDLAVFSLVFLACIVTNRHLKSGLFGMAGLLKFFPVAGMICEAIRRPTGKRKLAVLMTALVVFLILVQWRDFVLIRHATPVVIRWSYGVLSLEAELIHESLQLGATLLGFGWVFGLACLVACVATISHVWKNPDEPGILVSDSRYAEMFYVFGGIYVCTYAIGSNWDYRLVFLLPTLPLAMEMARDSRHRGWSIAYLVLVIVAENSLGFDASGGRIVGHIATLALFLMLVAKLTRQTRTLLFGNRPLHLADA